MPKTTSTGKCALCNKIFGKRAMTMHLKKCLADHAAKIPADGLLLLVEGYRPYWLYLAIPANLTLAALDSFLRDIWLECCGHMSQFIIDDTYYSNSDLEDARSANIKAGKILTPGLVFAHEYDMGSTTELRIKVLDELHGSSNSKKIALLSRNDPPDIRCQVCGQPATQICTECIYEDKGWLCDACAQKHECDQEMLLPNVNSPRVGVCGYSG